MSKSSVDVALCLKRIEPTFPQEVKSIQDYIAHLETEGTWTELVKEVTATIAQSRSAEERTAFGLENLKPLIERTTEALERMAEQERRRNDLEERRIKLEETKDAEQHEIALLKYNGIWMPVVGVLVGAISSAVAFYFGSAG